MFGTVLHYPQNWDTFYLLFKKDLPILGNILGLYTAVHTRRVLQYCTVARSTTQTQVKGLTNLAWQKYLVLILKAAATGLNKKIPHVGVDCDSNGIVTHGNNPCNPLSTNQTQVDLLRVFKNLVANQPFAVKFKYGKAHMDDTKRWRDCMLKERINIKVNGLAKKSLRAAISTCKFINRVFSNEQVWIEMGRKKISASLRSELEDFWGREAAKRFFMKRK